MLALTKPCIVYLTALERLIRQEPLMLVFKQCRIELEFSDILFTNTYHP
jgi:hypothetical protein